jgi:hypothetical protein
MSESIFFDLRNARIAVDAEKRARERCPAGESGDRFHPSSLRAFAGSWQGWDVNGKIVVLEPVSS